LSHRNLAVFDSITTCLVLLGIYEKDFPERSNIKAPRGADFPFGAFIFYCPIRCKTIFKGGRKMRRMGVFAILMIFFMAGIISYSPNVYAQSAKKVLMLPREGYSADLDLMIKMEVGVMRLLLKNAGLGVDVATTSGLPIVGSTEKITDIKQLRNINVSDYAGVIIPCMAVGGAGQPYPAVAPEVITIVKKALSDGKPVAANGNAPSTLAEAGVLKGKKYSYVRDPLKPTQNVPFILPAFQDATYGGSGLVLDGLIITSGICATLEKTMGLENGTVKLTKAFIAAVGGK
jgi:putative intracellular protease/amidase